VRHQQGIELLPDEVRRLAAQRDPCTPQMSLEFVDSCEGSHFVRVFFAGAAALRFDPESTGEMVAAIEAVACDNEFRARAAVAGPEQARKFDWLEAARATLRAMSI